MWHRDLFPFFRTPKETLVNVTLGGFNQLCDLNPDRVVLLISSLNNTTIFLTTSRALAPTGGISVGASAQPFILTQSLHGVLAQSTWFAAGSTFSGTITVIEVILDRKPTADNNSG